MTFRAVSPAPTFRPAAEGGAARGANTRGNNAGQAA